MAGSRVSALKGFMVPALFLSTQRVTVCVWWMAGGECGGCHLCEEPPLLLRCGRYTHIHVCTRVCMHGCAQLLLRGPAYTRVGACLGVCVRLSQDLCGGVCEPEV